MALLISIPTYLLVEGPMKTLRRREITSIYGGRIVAVGLGGSVLIALLALVLARSSVFERGLQAIPRGQHEASSAMGLHYWQSMRLVVLPQALKISIPPLVNISIGFAGTSCATLADWTNNVPPLPPRLLSTITAAPS